MEKEIPQRKSAVEKLRRQFHSEVTVRLIICLSQPLSSATLGVILFSFISVTCCQLLKTRCFSVSMTVFHLSFYYLLLMVSGLVVCLFFNIHCLLVLC